MSILGDIKRFSKKKLNPTTTKIQTVDGRSLAEKRDSKGVVRTKLISKGGLGFIGDYKPDLQVGEVLPGLIIGSQDVAADLELLRQHKVTHILNLASRVENIFPKLFRYKKIDILDLPSEKIIKHFPECFEFIVHGMSKGCVLVHCNAGVSRAASVVIGFLMLSKQMKYSEAFAYLRERRPCVCPNDGFRNQLREYEIQLRVKINHKEEPKSESLSYVPYSRQDAHCAYFLGL